METKLQVKAFILDHGYQDYKNGRVPTTRIFADFRAWQNQNGIETKSVSYQDFDQALRQDGNVGLTITRHGHRGERKRFHTGIDAPGNNPSRRKSS